MRVLVTGGTGFLGRKLVARLKYLGHDVTVIGRNRVIGEELEKRGIHFIQGNLEDINTTILSKRNMDYIFHAAALSSPWGRYEDFYNSNVLSTKNIVLASKENNIKRLIHISTPSIYFNFKNRFNISETDPLPDKSVNFYAETKKMAEDEIDKAHKDGLPVITIRPRALFGPNDNAILPRIIRVNNKGGVPIINNGQAVVDVTYVENVVDSLLLAMDAPTSTLGKKYNITNGEPMKLIDILEKMFTKIGTNFNKKTISYTTAYTIANLLEITHKYFLFWNEPLMTKYTVGLLSLSQTLDISAAKNELGYQPKTSIEEGLDIFARWWIKENK